MGEARRIRESGAAGEQARAQLRADTAAQRQLKSDPERVFLVSRPGYRLRSSRRMRKNGGR